MPGMVTQDRDSKVRARRKENHLRKEELPTIEKNQKKMQIICLQLIARVIKEAIPGVDLELIIKISSRIRISNNTCHSSLMQQISTHLLSNLKIKTLVKTIFHLVITGLEVSKLLKFTLLLRSSNLLPKFHQTN